MSPKNEYQVNVNGIKIVTGDYKTANEEFLDAIKEGEDGDIVELIKLKDNKGNDISELKKSEVVDTSKLKTKIIDLEKEIDIVVEEHLLDLFMPPAKEVRYDKLIKNKHTYITFRVSPKDYLYIIPGIDINKVLKDFSDGVLSKKPFILKVKEIKDKNDTNIDEKNVVLLKKKKRPTIKEIESLELLKQAQLMINKGYGEDSGVYLVKLIIYIEDNPNFGIEVEKEVKKKKKYDFSKDSSSELKRKLLSDEYNYDEKDEIEDILYERGYEVA